MTSISKPPGRNKPSIKYSGRRVERACFEVGDLNDKCCAPSASDNCTENGRKSEPKSSEILSTAELVSAVGQIWDCASRPLAFLQPRTKFRYNVGDFPEANAFCYSSGKGVVKSFASSESQDLPDNSITNGHFPPMVQEGLEFLRVSDKILSFRQQRWNFVDSLFSDLSHCSSNISGELHKEKSPTTSGMSYNLRNIYGWMSEPSDRELEQPVKSTLVENQKVGECCVAGDRDSTSYCNLNCTPSTANNLTIESADYTLQRTEATGNVLWTSSSRLNEENTIQYVASDSHVFEECQLNDEDDHLYVDKRSQKHAFVVTEKAETLICSPTHGKMNYGFAKQEHAFAGALAGLSVSVCLHPVDTVKTVIQSCRADQRSINYIRRSIISERGVTGLYRGIASNIASSAPISAVYTFTYESVKGALLPFFPAEYRSLAHCTAGGCASIATSFIFTPSERIKQQMQVGLHYQNCWKAGVGIIRMGGLSSLYAGWGAVLCRNVPHSIIKFYTYESLKHLMSSSQELNAHPDTSQTLICGGLAGSIAALFTTPFDVVKTRFQTQIPGSIHQYDSVLSTLINIGKHEGLKGLYRGLIPRLVMYVSQGAIFFASYESFKRLFSLEGP